VNTEIEYLKNKKYLDLWKSSQVKKYLTSKLSRGTISLIYTTALHSKYHFAREIIGTLAKEILAHFDPINFEKSSNRIRAR